MKKKRRFVFTTFHKTCLIFFLALFLISAGSFILYHQGTEMLRQEAVRSAEGSHAYASQMLKNEFNRIYTLQTVLNNNWDINKLSLFSDQYSIYARSEAMGNIKDKLWAVQSGSQIVESIHVYVSDLDTGIGSFSSGQALQEQRSIYSSLSELDKNKILYNGEKLMLLTESPYSSQADPQKPSFFIQTTFSNISLSNFLSTQRSEPESNLLLLYPGAGIILSEEAVAPGSPLYARLLKLPEEMTADSQSIRFTCDSQTYTAACSHLTPSNLYLVQYLPDNVIDRKLGPFYLMIVILFVFLVVASLFFSFSIYKIIHMPLNRLVKAYQAVENGDLDTHITPHGQGEFHYLYQAFDRMISRLQDSIRQAYQQQMLAQHAELKQLQSQIDPHFLYNSFFILNKRIRADDTEGALLLSQLMGSYFQYITRNGRDFVPLWEEVSHAQSYCEIQQIRFQNRLTLQIEPVPVEASKELVPRLILQPVCENAIKYAVENSKEDTVLRLRYEQREEGLFDIIVEDNGKSLSDDWIVQMRRKLEERDPGEITGMINIHRRLKLRYGEKCGVLLQRGPFGGLQVTLRILRTNRS